jgi:predicted metal-binding membrane protein
MRKTKTLFQWWKVKHHWTSYMYRPFCMATRYWWITRTLLLSILMALCIPVRWAATAESIHQYNSVQKYYLGQYDSKVKITLDQGEEDIPWAVLRHGLKRRIITLSCCWAAIRWFEMGHMVYRYPLSLHSLWSSILVMLKKNIYS